MFCFTFGYFPRGKVKAPKFVRPPEHITIDDLIAQIQLSFQNIENIKPIITNGSVNDST